MDVDEAPRHHKVGGMKNYRDQMIREAVIATNTAAQSKRINPNRIPLNLITDFTEDVKERLSYEGALNKVG
jgi:hypothetical protein